MRITIRHPTEPTVLFENDPCDPLLGTYPHQQWFSFRNALVAEGGITNNQRASFRHIHDEQEFQQALWRVMQQTR
jgi:hypothetical protein